MLRHSVFAVVLVGAAFAGGAVVNGTGLAWFKALASGGPRIVVDPTTEPGSAPVPLQPIPPNPFPAAPVAPPDLGQSPAPIVGLDTAIQTLDRPLSPAGPASTLAPAVAASEPPDLSLPPRFAAELLPTPAPAAAPAEPKTDPVARQASVQAGDLATNSVVAGTGRDWAELRRKFRTVGIARYEISAEVEGRVKFSCVIPVEGLRAVGHQFEADGDDEFQAAEAVLRRIALWRATESK